MTPSHVILRPPGEPRAFRGPVALSPDRSLLAFRRETGRVGSYDVCVAPPGGPPDQERILLHGDAGARPVDHRFSPSGRHLLVSLRHGESGRSFALLPVADSAPSRIDSTQAVAAAFWPADDTLVFARIEGGAVAIEERPLSAPAGETETRARVLARIALAEEQAPRLPTALAPSPDGRRVAVVVRSRAQDAAQVWAVPRAGGEPQLVVDLPGWALDVHPFWSPDGGALGLHLVHQELLRTAILVLPELEGGGELWYDADFLDPDHVPAWSPDGRRLAFFRVVGSATGLLPTGPASLVCLDIEAHLRAPVRVDVRHAAASLLADLTEPGAIDGRPFFLDARTLAVEAHDGAHVFTFDEATGGELSWRTTSTT